MTILISIIVWIIFLVVCVNVGKEKNRNGFLWGFFFGPFGLLILAILPKIETSNSSYVSQNSYSYSERECRSCRKIIPSGYSSCPNCGFSETVKNSNVNLGKIAKIGKIEEKYLCPHCNNELKINYDNFKEANCERCNKKVTKNTIKIG